MSLERRKGMRKNFWLIAFGLLFLSLSLLNCTRQQDKIRIGVLLPLSGSTASFGQECLKGLQIARDEINGQGGIREKRIELVLADTQGDTQETERAVRTLIYTERVLLVIGEAVSANSLVAAPLCQKAKVPMISPASTNPKLTEVGDYIFRVCFSDPFQGSAMANFARNTLKTKTALIVSDANSEYSRGLAEFFSKRFRELNGTILREIWYVQGENDFTPEIEEILQNRPDCVFVPGYYVDSATLIRQARAKGIKTIFLGGDGWDSPRLFELAGPAIEGSYITTHFSSEDRDSLVQEFVKKYETSYKRKPGAMSALGYDALKVVAQAIEKANIFNRVAIRETLSDTKGVRGVTGTITLDRERNAIKDVVVLKTLKDRFTFVEKVSP